MHGKSTEETLEGLELRGLPGVVVGKCQKTLEEMSEEVLPTLEHILLCCMDACSS